MSRPPHHLTLITALGILASTSLATAIPASPCPPETSEPSPDLAAHDTMPTALSPYPFDPLIAGKLVKGEIPLNLREPLRQWNKVRTTAEDKFRTVRTTKLHPKASDDERAVAACEILEYLSQPSYRSLISAFAGAPIDDQRLAISLLQQQPDDYAAAVLADTALRARSLDTRAIARDALITRLSNRAAPESVQRVIRAGLRSNVRAIRHDAASISRSLNLINMLPLIIAGQTVGGSGWGNTGPGPARAFIQIGTQQAYVRDLVPVVGSGAAAFDPVPGVLTTGTVLVVDDAVVTTSRNAGIVGGGAGAPVSPSGYPTAPSIAGNPARTSPPSPFTSSVDMEMRRILLAWAKDLTGEDLSKRAARIAPWRAWYETELPAALAKKFEAATAADPAITKTTAPAPLTPWDLAAKLPGHPAD